MILHKVSVELLQVPKIIILSVIKSKNSGWHVKFCMVIYVVLGSFTVGKDSGILLQLFYLQKVQVCHMFSVS